jgi:formylglycine-generating enzyme required for sulfatase activity
VGEIKKIPLPKGEYELKFVTMDGKDIVEDVHFVMPDSDKQYLIELLHEQEIRKKKEELASIERENKKKMENGQFDVNGVSFKMVRVHGGTYWMGADNGFRGLFKKVDNTVINFYGNARGTEKPVHQVTLKEYFIGETVVTQELWQAVMDSNPSCFKGSNNPVENVSWNDCQAFI